ncbi:MAG: hypothetical protein A3H96_16850 [Acidobacteria bacterium RIFCSPLOWO2_02_FULL_67_36]|nr:MAG: hypothetical protein A3H96_16850 [Acidobacteria bacterium RIFCSPLOWO2_02_FULL_67_36]OFW21524.1 MAG: hypothetical protein A3G21_00115 [Acidobacteria bacterium RIFCSPLOWO2_12_FULL_66_21]
MLLRQRWWTLAVIVTLAFGIGGTISTFSFVNAFVLRPLPFADPDRLVHVWNTPLKSGNGRGRISAPDYLDLRREAALFEDLAAFNYTEEDLISGGEPERVSVGRVTANAFRLLGVDAALGRGFGPGADSPAGPREVVLADSFWKTRFGGNRAALGGAVNLNGDVYTVVGVMPANFVFPLPITQMWAPRVIEPASSRSRRALQVFGRLRAGVEPRAGSAELKAIAARLAERYPSENAGLSVRTVPIRDALNFASDQLTPMLAIMSGSVGMVFLIVCSNVASLMLSRGLARRREMALRAALGAGRLRLVRQLLTESLLLALLGGAGGAAFAVWGLARARAAIPPDLYRIGELVVDREAIAFTFGISLLAAVLFGLVPALRVTRGDLSKLAADGLPGGRPAGRAGGQRRLVAGQIAMCTVLLIAAVLLVGSVRDLRRVPLGFDADRVLTVKLIVPEHKYADAESVKGFHRDIVARAARLPGVVAAGTVDYLPLNHEWAGGEVFPSGQPIVGGDGIEANLVTAGGDYFGTVGLRLLQGGLFATSDNPAARETVIASALARRLFGDTPAVGRQFAVRRRGVASAPYTVKGVVSDSRHQDLRSDVPNIYFSQASAPTRYMRLLVRVRPGDSPAQQAPALRAAVREFDPQLPVTELRPLREVVDEFLVGEVNIARMLTEHAVTALVLALVGIYGVMAFSVAARTREIAVRMALGASRANVIRQFVRQAAGIGGTGVALGLALAYALARFLSSLLFGVSAGDPLTFVAVGTLLFAMSLLACYLPVRRAAMIDPADTLRAE